MTIAEIKRVCFIGAGTMGCYNALIATMAGYHSVIYDTNIDNLKAVPAKLHDIAVQLAQHQGLDEQHLSAVCESIETESNLSAAVAGAQLISESIFENLELKQKSHSELDAICAPDVLLTTNTSALLASDIERDVKNKSRFAALHSYLGSPLVDVVAGSATSVEVIKILERYVQSLGGVPLLLKKEYPGYVLNALLGRLLASALDIVINGMADNETVDRSWMHFMKAPMGPFGMMDMFGLDLVLDSWKNKAEDSQLTTQVIELLSAMVAQQQVGMKTGQGFYSYPEPSYQDADVESDQTQWPLIYTLLMSAVITSASQVVLGGVLSEQEVDQCWKVGTGLHLGPFEAVQQQGIETTITTLTEIQKSSPSLTDFEFEAIIKFISELTFDEQEPLTNK